MIHFLKGIVVEKSPTKLIVEVGGIGYELAITLSSYETFAAVGERVEVLTYVHLREDAVQLYGFASAEEREVFLLLISVSGIGPKLAQGILSSASVDELRMRISQGDVTALAKLRGVGKKTAQRLVLDLRDKLGATAAELETVYPAMSNVKKNVIDEAILALLSLGYSRAVAQEVMEKTLRKEAPQNENITVEELVKRALRNV